MRAYADSSFILKLILKEPDSEQAIAEYRRHGRPQLFFLPLHDLEVRNAVLQRAFHQRRALSSGDRRHIARERDAAFSRLEILLARRTLLDASIDTDAAIRRATELSGAHTETMGLRAIDLLHVASALLLESECFFTTDERQALLAKAAGLEAIPPLKAK